MLQPLTSLVGFRATRGGCGDLEGGGGGVGGGGTGVKGTHRGRMSRVGGYGWI